MKLDLGSGGEIVAWALVFPDTGAVLLWLEAAYLETGDLEGVYTRCTESVNRIYEEEE